MDHSGSAALQRSDLLVILSVLDLDTVLERAATIGAYRTGARSVALAVLDDGGEAGTPPDVAAPLRLATHGIAEDEAAALRDRLGAEGLPLAHDGRPTWRDPAVARLRDPGTGGEVLRLPVLVNGRVFADLLVADPPPGGFAESDVESLAVLGRVTGVAARNALSYALSERRREAVQLAAAVDQSLRAPYLLAEPAARIAEGALRIARARTAAVVTAGDHGVDVAAATGEDTAGLADVLAGILEPLRRAQADGTEVAARVGDAAVLGVPLSPEQAYEGVVVLVLDPESPRVPAESRTLLASFVRHGSLVLDHGLLQRERQHAVLAADRDRIARDLHDVVIQRLYAAGLKLRATARGGADFAAEVARDLDDSIRDIRSTIFELERGRRASLRSDVVALTREYEPALGFMPVVRTWGPVDSMVEQHLAEQATVVLREALSNCVRHAGAGRCEVDVSVDSDWLTLQVVDDGRGPGHGQGPRSGLRNLAARAAELGGTLLLEPHQPRGTRLRWRVPLGQDPSAAPATGPGDDSGTGSDTGSGPGTKDVPGSGSPRGGSGAGSPAGTVEDAVPAEGQSHSSATDSSTQQRPAASR
jgi:signal transduction histidine kinase